MAAPARPFTVNALITSQEPSNAAFTWLSAFYVVYCARPEDWIPGLKYIPLAKISVFFALAGLMVAAGKTKRRYKDLPKEANYLLALIAILFVSAIFSPVWKGGAVVHTLDFAKVYVVWVLTFLVVTDFKKLRRIIFVQAGSVAVIAVVSIAKGYSHPRLEGVLGGIYGNPNDLAFAIVLSLPFCLAFLISAKGALKKLLWALAMLVMAASLFLTASRAGFIDLVIAGTVCLWHFGVKGKRPYLIVIALVLGALLMAVAGRQLKDRFTAMSGEDLNTSIEGKAYTSFEARQMLMRRAVEGIEHYPILGVGVNNFMSISGDWHEVHMTYLEIAVEGGIFSFVLYLMFFSRGFSNLRRLRRRRDLDTQSTLFAGALHSSLIGFAVGALFAPEAYQFFPYFAVAYTSVLAIIIENQSKEALTLEPADMVQQPLDKYARQPSPSSRIARL
ncbi:MAG TPA: O-antigen ligase family protein [Terriglobales bacterium]|nr:O-antigen ligase family protein [Terriglobales bacterium]